MPLPYPRRDDRESIAADAVHVVDMTPEERAAVFIDLNRSMEAILEGIPAAEDLILRKMAFHRQKDLQDIEGILHVQKGHLDMPYLRRWSGEMLEPPAIQELEELIATYVTDRSK